MADLLPSEGPAVTAAPGRGGALRDMVIAYGHSACSAAAYPHASVEHRWLRDRWLAALNALGITEEQARAECRAAMRGIHSDTGRARLAAHAAGGADGRA